MIHFLVSILVMTLTLIGLPGCGLAAEADHLLNLSSQTRLTLGAAVTELKTKRIILVGEHHTEAEHHRRQLAVIQALDQSGVSVAIGMEMFRSDSQNHLDRWRTGQMAEAKFVPV